VGQLFTAEGAPKFKYVVEGANLFFTADARKVLEEGGVKLFKDASTNKGGVTSSSLEVLAALAMHDADHTEHMCVGTKDTPEFYKRYTEEILAIIRRNASAEFNILWTCMENGQSSASATDQVSAKINKLTDDIFKEFVDSCDEALMEKILRKAFPKALLDHTGYETLRSNAPDNYLRAICATHLASKYIYKVGLHATEFSFHQFMQREFSA
jgi:glutamate dehydrogenase